MRPGDTLYSIGKKFGVDYHLIARRNHLRYPYEIYVGQALYIDRYAPRQKHSPAARHIKRVTKARKPSSTHKKTAHHTLHKAKPVRGVLHWPVHGRITSPFGRRGTRMHDGIDIGAKEGTAVHAAAAGTVVYSDHRLRGYGNLVIIRHGKNLFTAYGHNQRNLVRKGQRVGRGEVIARVGHTGRATGPHLHFEVRRGSVAVDPLAYLPH